MADPGGQGGHAPSQDAEVAFWFTAITLIKWQWNSANEQT